MVIAGGSETVQLEGVPTEAPFTITEESSYPVSAWKVKVICVGQSTSKFPDGEIEPPTEADALTGHMIAASTGLTSALMLKTRTRVNNKRAI